MKDAYLLLLMLNFSSCTIFGDDNPYQKAPQGLPGSWKLVELTGSIGSGTYTK